MRIDEEDVKLEILDTAGEINLSMKENYSLWPDCFVLVYSTADKYSLKNNEKAQTRPTFLHIMLKFQVD